MTKTGKRAAGMQRQAEKLKRAEVGVWRYLLSIAVFIGFIFLLFPIIGGSQNIWDAFAWFYLAAAAVATIIDALQGNVPLRPDKIFLRFTGYVFKLFAEVLLIALCIPVLALVFILGPLMCFVCLLGLGLSVMYVIVVVLGINIKGVVITYGGLFALGAFAASVISGLVFFTGMDRGDRLMEAWVDKVTDVFLFLNNRGKRGEKESKK